jgi:hypothetical protein
VSTPQDEMLDDAVTVTIPLETLKHLFDLAVDTPLLCSGSFDTDDVNVLRETAERIGADPEAITPDEFITQYVHTFKPRPVNTRPWPVQTGNPGPAGRGYRQETPEETAARNAEERADVSCQAGSYGRKCGLPEDDPKHRKEVTS